MNTMTLTALPFILYPAAVTRGRLFRALRRAHQVDARTGVLGRGPAADRALHEHIHLQSNILHPRTLGA